MGGALGVSEEDRRHDPLRPWNQARSAFQNENCWEVVRKAQES
jgi:hypothetical protein